MSDVHLLNSSYEILELRNGVAVLRNIDTGRQIEEPVSVNLNDGVVRIGGTATPVGDSVSSR